MREGKCPKCGSTEVYRGIQQAFTSGYLVASQRYAETRYFLEPYVCTECGYVEFHLEKGSLDEISVLIQDKVLWQKTT
ncbi:MAG: hypothetical protein JXA97_12270 [Anaerolineales bacterium]|nr:hypothetical protein [Anaerolineales bacterium]